MIPKPNQIKSRYLSNNPREYIKWLHDALDMLSVLGKVGLSKYNNTLNDTEFIYHIILTPESAKHQNITTFSKMLAFKLDYYNIAIHPNCALNQIDIFIQVTLLP